LSNPTSLELGADGGFTLIEGLVALAIVAAAVGAIVALSGQSLRATMAAERRMALVATARMIEAGLPGRAKLPDGRRSGALDDHQWRLETSSYSPGARDAASPWRPHRLSLSVQGPGGETLQIETIRLQMQAAP
jgi:general secretion pathway protein I